LVTVIKDEHTCNPEDFDPTAAKRTELTKLTFLREAVPKLMIVDYATTPQEIIEAIKQRYGQEIPIRQAQKVKAVLCPKDKHGCKFCGGPAHRSRRCMQDPLFSADGDNSINPAANEADSGMQVDYEDTALQNGQNPVMLLQQENMHSTQSANHASAYETPRMVPSQGFQAVRQLTGRATLTRDSRAVVAAPPQNNPLAEAAEMMKRAAQLMQEAAQLNTEAARLMASAVPR
jgi:flagellar biosynthesis GTPase FlhF